jgi:hypothetical protein
LPQGGRYLEGDPQKSVLVMIGWDFGWSLMTGGRCSEVAVNTGLTVVKFMLWLHFQFNLPICLCYIAGKTTLTILFVLKQIGFFTIGQISF